MEASRDPSSAEIARFLATRTGSQMVQLMQAVREPAAQAALAAELLRVSLPVPGSINKSEKPKKALNAFVGFRCYYLSIPIFKTWPMKKISFFMGLLWDADPNKSLWSLMAKAWSIIRDQVGKDKAPLDQFFDVICPYLNMPSPKTYLECHGWNVAIDEAGEPTLSRETASVPASITAEAVDIGVSVEHIIAHCQIAGYAPDFVPNGTYMSQAFLARAEARKKRRAKRELAKTSKMIPILREQIARAHDIPTFDPREQVDTSNSNNGNNEFYNHVAGLLNDHMANYQGDNSSLPTETVANPVTLDSDMSAWIDWNDFSMSAADNATIPSFGLSLI